MRVFCFAGVHTIVPPALLRIISRFVPLWHPSRSVLAVAWVAAILSLPGLYAARAQTAAPGTVEAAFNPGVGLGETASVSAAIRQPDGKILLAGSFSYLDGALRHGLVRLLPNGRLDPGFQPPETRGSVDGLALQPDGRILFLGTLAQADASTEQRTLVRLNADGSEDTLFRVDPSVAASFDSGISTFILQPDGKILVGASGSGGVVRLLGDGQRDMSFIAVTGFDFGITALAVQGDGKILAGGYFTTVDGMASTRLVRLRADGRVDTAFPSPTADDLFNFAGYVRSIAVQPNGKILVAGAFTPVGGNTVREGLTRLNANGTLDTSFRPAANIVAAANKITLQGDGNVLVNVPTPANAVFFVPAGSASAQGRNAAASAASDIVDELTSSVVETSHIYRLRPDGSFDPAFTPVSVFGPPSADAVVTALVLQSGGRILVGGRFNALNTTRRGSLALLGPDGSVEGGFDPAPQLTGGADVLLPLPDGRLLVGGRFVSADGQLHVNLTRFRANDQPDENFLAETDGEVFGLARGGDDGSFYLLGAFRHVNGVARANIARIRANGSLDTGFVPDPTIDFAPVAMAVQTDGKVIVVGGRNAISIELAPALVRLNRDGRVDTGFRPALDGRSFFSDVAVHSDGRIVVSYVSGFTGPNAPPASGLLRLLPDGGGDDSFRAETGSAPFFVGNFLLMSDGRIVISRAGVTQSATGEPALLRLLPDGQRDRGFSAPFGTNELVRVGAIQPDGKILVIHLPTAANASRSPSVLRLNGDGSLDDSFRSPVFEEPAAGFATILGIALQGDGRVLVGGYFSVVDGQVHRGLARLSAGPALPGFFAGQTSIGDNWYHLDFFGDYYAGLFPYLYHAELGWLYFIDARDAARGAFLYDFSLRGFLYTSPTLFPYLYDFNARAFLYYFRGTSHPRVFANLKTGQFVFSD